MNVSGYLSVMSAMAEADEMLRRLGKPGAQLLAKRFTKAKPHSTNKLEWGTPEPLQFLRAEVKGSADVR